ncbi:MAG: hypothetical protein N2381_09580 [Armatimonadetes bacterium]|nr:hypothetical protein [Armatimonadota bacterium]
MPKTTRLILAIWALAFMAVAFAQQSKKASTVTGEVVCLTCYLSHGAKGEGHAKCAATCINKGLPMGILTKDGKLFVAIEDHANAAAYQQLKKFAAKIVTATGIIASRNNTTGIAIQKVEVASATKTTATKAQYACPMACIPPQDKPGNCPKCGMKLVRK